MGKKTISVTESIQMLLKEASVDKIVMNGNPYKMVLDVTEAETKEGVRITFTPLQEITSSKDDITNLLQKKINDTIETVGLSVSTDNDNLEENSIRFLLPVAQLTTWIKSAFSETTTTNAQEQNPVPTNNNL